MKIEKLVYDLSNGVSKSINFSFSPKCRQAYVALGPTLLTISLGMVEGYSAIFLPQLVVDDQWNIDTDMESWIASIATLSMFMGSVLAGFAMDIIGRRGTHQLDCVLNLIGWLILYFASENTSILIARFITGFTVGLIGPASPAYMAETADPNFRGVTLAFISFAITFGIGFSHFLGSFLHWKPVALISCLFPIVAFVSMLFAPESPTFLIKKSKIEAGTKAFYWCRGNDPLSEKELKILIERQGLLTENKFTDFRQYSKPEFIKPLLLMTVFFFTLQWCGSNALTFYTVSILQKSLKGQINEYYSMVFIDIVRIMGSVAAVFVQRKIRRRPHAIFSVTGILLSLITLSSTLYASRFFPVVMEKYSIILVVAFATYMAFLSLGVNPVPWTMIGEVFPLASKGVGCGISVCCNFLFIFSVVKTTPFLFDSLGADGAFLLYAVATLSGLIILVIFLPETKGKPLHEIEDRFKGNIN